jgi:hypothetical protein
MITNLFEIHKSFKFERKKREVLLGKNIGSLHSKFHAVPMSLFNLTNIGKLRFFLKSLYI